MELVIKVPKVEGEVDSLEEVPRRVI